jgi:hypothetical protein
MSLRRVRRSEDESEGRRQKAEVRATATATSTRRFVILRKRAKPELDSRKVVPTKELQMAGSLLLGRRNGRWLDPANLRSFVRAHHH